MDLSRGPGEAFGLLAFLGAVLVLAGLSDEPLRRRAVRSPRPSISRSSVLSGRSRIRLGAVAMVVGLVGLLVVWALG